MSAWAMLDVHVACASTDCCDRLFVMCCLCDSLLLRCPANSCACGP